MPPCVHLLVLLVVLLVIYSVVHKLNTMSHEMFHLWRISVACWIVLGKTLMCLILFPLLFWVCIPYVIFSVPLMVLCTSRFLHVVPMMLYHLDYCELLLLSLVGLTVSGFYQILQIFWWRLIGGEELLIVWANLDWLLPDVIVCPTIEYAAQIVASVEDICGMLNCFGKNLLCLILSPLFPWGCMPYVIFSVIFLVLCTSHIIHVVPMIIVRLDYYKWLFLSQMGLTVCDWNQIIQKCGYRLIGG